MQHRTSLTDQTSGCRISASAGDFLMRRKRHVAAFLRTMDLTAPFVCSHGTLRKPVPILSPLPLDIQNCAQRGALPSAWPKRGARQALYTAMLM